MPLGEPEGVHVRGLLALDRREQARRPGAACHLHLVAGRRDQRDVVENAPPTLQAVRVHGLDLAERVLGAHHAERAQRARIELHRKPDLGEGHEVLSKPAHVHVRVADLRQRERGLRSVEDRPAGIGGELGVADDPLLLVGLVGRAAEEAVGVAHASALEGERVEHPEPVEPVVEGPLAHLVEGGPVAHERAREPLRQAPLHGQPADPHLLAEALEAEPPVAAGRERAGVEAAGAGGDRGDARASAQERAAGDLVGSQGGRSSHLRRVACIGAVPTVQTTRRNLGQMYEAGRGPTRLAFENGCRAAGVERDNRGPRLPAR